MSKNNILKNIEEGLLNYYLDKRDPDPVDGNHIYEAKAAYGDEKYQNKAKQILLKARAQVNKEKITKVISIAEAQDKLRDYADDDKAKVISIFNRHVKLYGLAVNYRNFDQMSVDEIKDILSQIDLTALFNDIDSTLGDD